MSGEVETRSPAAYVLLYVALYAAFGVASPFWPKLFQSKGLSPDQIGWILGVGLFVRLAAGPLIGRLADRWRSLRLVLAVCIVTAAAAAAAFLSVNTFGLLLLVAMGQGAALAPTTSVADALTVNASPPSRAGKHFEYGWIRGAASAAFLIGTLVIGQFISTTDLRLVVWTNAGLLLVAASAIALVPAAASNHSPDEATSIIAVRRLLRQSAFRAVIVISALVFGSHAMYDGFAVIRWTDAGLEPAVVSVLWAEAVAAEVIVFFVIGPRLISRLGARNAAVVAATAGVVRWSAMGFVHSIPLLLVLQLLHGLTFALLYLACMRVMATVVPTHLAATAQALYAFGAGLVTAALSTVSGTLYATGAAAFLPMSVLCFIAVPFAWYGLANISRSKLLRCPAPHPEQSDNCRSN